MSYDFRSWHHEIPTDNQIWERYEQMYNGDLLHGSKKKMTRYESLRALIEHTSPVEFEDWIREVDNQKTWFGRWLDKIEEGESWDIREQV